MSGNILLISNYLNELEEELKALQLWGGEQGRPEEKAFLDPNPFCLDSMDFHQWLEYVLIAKFREMIAAENPLPDKMCVHTYAQEKYRGQWSKYRNLIVILRKLDEEVSA